MAISYPLSLPSVNPKYSRVELRAASAVGISTSPFTFESQRQEYAGMHWDASITQPAMVRADAEEWIAFLLKLNGPVGTFLLGDPLGTSPRGSASSPGTPKVNGGGQTGQSLNTKDWTADATGILLAGDYLQIGNRLYKNLNDVDADASGLATLDIWPRLRESPSDNDSILTNSTVGLFRLVNPELVLASLTGHQDAGVYSMVINATEAI